MIWTRQELGEGTALGGGHRSQGGDPAQSKVAAFAEVTELLWGTSSQPLIWQPPGWTCILDPRLILF